MALTDIVLTILTGARPTMLERTLVSVAEHLPALLDEADVHVLINGGDDPTCEVVERYCRPGWHVTTRPGPIATIGQATSWCAEQAATSNRLFWLHLEDDWEAHPGTLDLAQDLLSTQPEVSQVRLRQAGERWAHSNLVTHRQLAWTDRDGYRLSKDCHLTQTPFLMRTPDASDAYPATDEREAMKHWRDAGHLVVAQLVPGIFTHLGGIDSLRRRMKSPARLLPTPPGTA